MIAFSQTFSLKKNLKKKISRNLEQRLFADDTLYETNVTNFFRGFYIDPGFLSV